MKQKELLEWTFIKKENKQFTYISDACVYYIKYILF